MEDYKKNYEDSMKKIKRLHESVNPKCKQIIEYYFPELKESEDEKIRKGILNFLKEFEYDHYRNLDFSSWIAWLEKQGEQKPTWSEEDEKIFNVICEELSSYIRIEGYSTPLSVADINWLKSLKERMKGE